VKPARRTEPAPRIASSITTRIVFDARAAPHRSHPRNAVDESNASLVHVRWHPFSTDAFIEAFHHICAR
jgi:hypothetical protein